MTGGAENGEPLLINMAEVIYFIPNHKNGTMDIHFDKKALRIEWKLDIIKRKWL